MNNPTLKPEDLIYLLEVARVALNSDICRAVVGDQMDLNDETLIELRDAVAKALQ
jgi:hypothetical protein